MINIHFTTMAILGQSHNIARYSIFLLLLFASLCSFSQGIDIYQQGSSVESYDLKTIRNNRIENGNLILTFNDGSTKIYALNLLKYLSFNERGFNGIDRLKDRSNINFSIFPNPVSELLNISIESPIAESITYYIYDIEGKKCKYSKSIQMNAGKSEEILSLAFLKPGNYILYIEGNNICLSKVFQVI